MIEIDNTSLENLKKILGSLIQKGRGVQDYDLTVILVALDPQCLHEDEEKEIAARFLHERGIHTIKSLIRNYDEIYFLSDSSFLIHLKETHEAGADFVASRIKKALSSAAKEAIGLDLCFMIGTCSKSIVDIRGVDDILKILLTGLEVEKNCQPLLFKNHQVSCKATIGPVLLYGVNQEIIKGLGDELVPFGYRIENLDAIEDGTEQILEQRLLALEDKFCVLLIGDDLTKKDEIKSKIKNIRQNRRLDCIFIIVINSDLNSAEALEVLGVDLVLSSGLNASTLTKHIMKGYQISVLRAYSKLQATHDSILESIRAASHKLNQPLQVILGKADLVELGVVGQDQYPSIFEDIKKSVLLLSDINSKIARIASGKA
ncbi:hypothetical protein DBT_1389 [Dissulfuribacter thermophilus]|uniref:Uncharacterized protein n=1 Tax=Dissulfuribacter thermophilus TaxID=1156395 RepID=A0A1B9F5R6_9BACT|nr:hypothetical protein [Dissulfuribacter thermophilus]OCC15266.1 hypothetical protein DBT_1389 [Dissulfuribacter thermophilus]